MLFTKCPLLLTSYTPVAPVTTDEPALAHCYKPRFTLYSEMLSVYPMPFAAPGSHLGYDITFSHHVSLASSTLPVSQTVPVSGDLDPSEEYCSGVLETVLQSGFV